MLAFLDANVLFSAAFSENSGLVRLWHLQQVNLCTSAYAVEEARRNLRDEAAQDRLRRLLREPALVSEAAADVIPKEVVLREKDRPILAAAIAAQADYLVTGDQRDFGALFGKKVRGVRIVRPRELIELHEAGRPLK